MCLPTRQAQQCTSLQPTEHLICKHLRVQHSCRCVAQLHCARLQARRRCSLKRLCSTLRCSHHLLPRLLIDGEKGPSRPWPRARAATAAATRRLPGTAARDPAGFSTILPSDHSGQRAARHTSAIRAPRNLARHSHAQQRAGCCRRLRRGFAAVAHRRRPRRELCVCSSDAMRPSWSVAR